MEFVTCAVCDSEMQLIPDGIYRLCPCSPLGVDCTKEYTEYRGTIPKEHPGYDEWYLGKKEVIERLREHTRK